MAAPSTDNVLKLVAVGGAILFADKLAAMFAPDKPGGDVDPNQGDTRPATIDSVQARQLADRIAVDVWGSAPWASPTEDDEDIAAALMVCRVTNDVRLLMNAYGEQGTYLAPLNLSQTIASYLDADYRAAVNLDYTTKGITINF